MVRASKCVVALFLAVLSRALWGSCPLCQMRKLRYAMAKQHTHEYTAVGPARAWLQAVEADWLIKQRQFILQ